MSDGEDGTRVAKGWPKGDEEKGYLDSLPANPMAGRSKLKAVARRLFPPNG